MKMMRKGLHIGTSGWSYIDKTGWLDVFYHSRKSLLKQYLAVFQTAEINSTFYSLPRPTFVKHLTTLKGDKFFTAKIPRKVTHDHRLELKGEGGRGLEPVLHSDETCRGSSCGTAHSVASMGSF